MRSVVWVAMAVALAACGHSEPPASAPATVTAAAPATAQAAPAATHPAAPAATMPAPASSAAPAAATTAGPESAGSVALSQGSVTDQATDGSTRQLKDGDTVYTGDAFTIGDDSYLDLDLEDGGRILLRPDSNFQIQEYHFDPDAHPAAGEPPLLAIPQQKPESAFFKLVKGGLRAVDGLIGQSHPQSYGVVTPVATIGVRGTAFDVRYCGDDCKDEADTGGAPQNGLYTSVTEGSIGVKNDSGETVTKAGEYSYVQSRKVAVQKLAQAPHALRHMSLPPTLKARADKNREQINTKRQVRRKQVLEQRRQQAAAKPKPPEAKANKPEKEQLQRGKAKSPAERQQRREQRREEQRPGAAAKPVPQHPAQAQPGARREQRQERMEQRRTQQPAGKPAERAAGKPLPQPAAAVKPQPKQEKQEAKPDCKDKKRKREKDKDKDKCGG